MRVRGNQNIDRVAFQPARLAYMYVHCGAIESDVDGSCFHAVSYRPSSAKAKGNSYRCVFIREAKLWSVVLWSKRNSSSGAC